MSCAQSSPLPRPPLRSLPRRTAVALPTTVALLLASGCGLGSLPLDEACPETRRRESGECCPAWTAPEGIECVEREWSLPAEGDGLGEAGVRWVDVAVDGHGRATAAWIESATGDGRVVVAEESQPAAGFSLRSPSSALSGTAVQLDLAAGLDGAAVIGWKQQYPGDEARVFVSEREPDGAWNDPLSEEGSFSLLPTAYEPHPIVFPNGERLVVWNQWMSTGYGVAVARKPPSGEWQFPDGADDVLSPHVFYSNAPNPAVNARGDALISWYQSDGGALLAYQSERFGYEGSFSRPPVDDYLSVRDTPVDSHPFANPRPALSERGDAAVVWTQENGKGSVLVYLATRTPDGAWTRPASVDDALSPPLGYARCAQVAFTPSGDLFVVWYQDSGGGNRVLAAHRSPDGEWIEPGDAPTELSSPGAEGIFPVLAIGGEGGLLATWSERRGDDWVIAARRRAQAGTSWGPVEVLSVQNGAGAAQPAAAIGGAGDRAVVGWTQGAGAGDRAFFATVDVK